MKRSHAIVVREAQYLRQHSKLLFPTVHNQLTGLRIEDVKVVGRFEHAEMLFHQVQVAIEYGGAYRLSCQLLRA